MLKFQQFDRRNGEVIDIRPCVCHFGITEVLIPVIASLATSAGVGAVTAGTIASIAAPALVSAGIGAAGSAILGGDPGQGALFGGLSGAVGPALGAMGIGGSSTGGGGLLGRLFGSGSGSTGNMLTGDAAQALESGNAIGSALDAEGNPISSYATGAAGLNPAAGQSASTAAATAGGIKPAAGTGGAIPGLGLGSTLGLLGALIQNSSKPNGGVTTATPPPGFSTPWNPNSGALARTQNQFTPSTGSYYTYGQQAEPQFFNNNALSFQVPHMARGGALRHAMNNGRYASGGAAFSTGGGENHVQGDGDGVSDSIPARLSNDEYVFTAADVSRIGNGSTNAGVQKLDQMRQQIAHDAGARKYQGQVQPPLSYLRKAA